MEKYKKAARKTVVEADNVANEETPLDNHFDVGENSISGAGVTRNKLNAAIANVSQRMDASTKAMMERLRTILNARPNPLPQKVHVDHEEIANSSSSDHDRNDNMEDDNEWLSDKDEPNVENLKPKAKNHSEKKARKVINPVMGAPPRRGDRT